MTTSYSRAPYSPIVPATLPADTQRAIRDVGSFLGSEDFFIRFNGYIQRDRVGLSADVDIVQIRFPKPLSAGGGWLEATAVISSPTEREIVTARYRWIACLNSGGITFDVGGTATMTAAFLPTDMMAMNPSDTPPYPAINCTPSVSGNVMTIAINITPTIVGAVDATVYYMVNSCNGEIGHVQP